MYGGYEMEIFMKKRIFLMVLLVKIVCFDGLIQANMYGTHRKLDPVSDFRYPPSLVEILHTKINNIHCTLDGEIRQIHRSLNLSSLEQEFLDLSTLYDETVNTSQHHTMRSDDKEFLEKMIERIDQLIAQLEGTDKKKSYQQLKSLSDEFKQKISS